jgi:cell division protein ZapA (FtsZ GTPase activity inhibitor)
MSEANRPILVNILGSNYTIKGSDWDAGHITKIAEALNDRMRELDSRLKIKSLEKTAVLTALNLENELFFAEIDKHKYLEETEKRVNAIISRIDKALLDSFLMPENPAVNAKDINKNQ